MRLKMLAAAFLLSTTTPGEAKAPDNCGTHRQVSGLLENRFRERIVAQGITSDNRLLQVMASDRSGSWSIITTTTDGHTCLQMGGREWQMMLQHQGAKDIRM